MKSLMALGTIFAVQGVSEIPSGGNAIAEVIKIVIQVVLGIASLIHMFKKPKEVISNQNTL